MRFLSIALLLFATVACVPKGKYDEALAEQDRLGDRVEALESTVSQLSGNIDRLKTDLATAEAALEETSSQLATKISEAGELQEDIEQMTRALQELERRKAQTEQSLSAYRDLLDRFKSLIDAGTLKVKVVQGRMLVELATDILFPAGSASLSKEGQEALKEVATVLADIPDRRFQVAGHTDDVPISTAQFPSNWHLGSARAIAVVSLMTTAGLPADRISASSYADTQPIDTNRTKEGRANNRRIEIIVEPDLSSLPGYDELEALGSDDDEAAPKSMPKDAPSPAPAPMPTPE